MALRDGSEAGTVLGSGLKSSCFAAKPGVQPVGQVSAQLRFGMKAITLGTENVRYLNRVYDPGGPAYVSWTTYDAPDTLGAAYPDPYGTTFAGCTGFHVAGVISG